MNIPLTRPVALNYMNLRCEHGRRGSLYEMDIRMLLRLLQLDHKRKKRAPTFNEIRTALTMAGTDKREEVLSCLFKKLILDFNLKIITEPFMGEQKIIRYE